MLYYHYYCYYPTKVTLRRALAVRRHYDKHHHFGLDRNPIYSHVKLIYSVTQIKYLTSAAYYMETVTGGSSVIEIPQRGLGR